MPGETCLVMAVAQSDAIHSIFPISGSVDKNIEMILSHHKIGWTYSSSFIVIFDHSLKNSL